MNVLETVSPELLLADRARRVDIAIASAFDRTQPNVTVVAAGGYGRQELFPYSGVDIILLVDKKPGLDREKGPISEFLRLLWDQGLRVSQSVRSIEDCCELQPGNLDLTISLLDRRYIRGELTRFAELERSFSGFVAAHKNAIALEVTKAARARHARYRNTIYHLEPDVKEHPGGVQDLHVMHWFAKLGETVADDIEASRKFIYAIRLSLHDHFRRDNNVLNFDAQEHIFEDPSVGMREYYRSARDIYRSLTRALDRSESAHAIVPAPSHAREEVSNTEFTVSGERVDLRDPQRLEVDPGVVMRLMLFISSHELQIAPETGRRLRACTPVAPLWTQMRELLSLPRCASALRAMHETGILQKIIPEWGRIDSLVFRDFYHSYTVDEHTLLTLQAIDDLGSAQEGLHARFAELATEIDRPDLLRFALLLHDSGKGEGDPVAKSAEIAANVLARFGAPVADRSLVQYLIRHHLDLSSIMTSRDLGDPATGRQIAAQAGTVERLKLLALMTYADISSVNPEAMTPWKLELLWRSYEIAKRELTRELEAERIHPEPNTPRSEFLEGFPTRYLRTHTEAEVDRHMELARSGSILDLVRSNATYQMTVIAPDRPFLLASISGALSSFGVNILKAEAFSNRQGLVLDTFVFSDPLCTLELNPSEAEHLRETVTRCILGKTDVRELLKKRPQPASTGRIKPSVTFNNDVSAAATLIEIVAEDRPGLLYDLTSAISAAGCNIEVVLVDTEAQKALDVFYVTSAHKKLSPEVESILGANLQATCSPRTDPT